MLKLRVASAIVALPLIVLLIWAGEWWYASVVALILFVATLEFQNARGTWLQPLAFLSAGLSTFLAVAAHLGLDWMTWVVTGLVIIPLLWITFTSDTPTALTDWLWTAGAVLYLGWLGSHLVLLRGVADGRDWVYLTVFSAFATDTAAYFGGRAFGRRALAPSISPGKTVEGALFGFASGLAAVLLFNYFLGLRKEAALIVPLALLLPLAAQLGDLVESKLKRSMEIKEASRLIPGHGGLMDRLDSILLTVAVVYYYLTWVLP